MVCEIAIYVVSCMVANVQPGAMEAATVDPHDDCAKTASSNGTVPFQDIANSWSYRMRGHELRTQTNANHTTPAMAKHTVNAPLGSQATLGANDGPPAGSSPMNHSAASSKSHTKLAAKHPISSIALYSPTLSAAQALAAATAGLAMYASLLMMTECQSA